MKSTDRRTGVGAASKVWRLLATVGVFGLVGPLSADLVASMIRFSAGTPAPESPAG